MLKECVLDNNGNKRELPYIYMKFGSEIDQAVKCYYIADEGNWYSYGTGGKLIKETIDERINKKFSERPTIHTFKLIWSNKKSSY